MHCFCNILCMVRCYVSVLQVVSGVNCMQEQRYAVRVTDTRRMWYVRGENGQLMTRIENGIPHDKSGTWTFEEINSRGLDQMARIRI